MLRDTGHETVDRYQQALALEAWVASSGLAAHLGSPEARHDYVQSLDGDRFVGLVQGINAVLLNQPESTITTQVNAAFDHDGSKTLDIMPAPEDKVTLLHATLSAAQRLEDPAEQAVVLGFGANAVHADADANGRGARALYLLLSRDWEPGQERFYAALGENGDQAVNLDTNLFTPAIYEMVKVGRGSHQFDPATGMHTIPNVRPIVKDNAFLTASEVRTSRRAFDADTLDTMRTIFADENVGQILAHQLATRYQNMRVIREATLTSPQGKQGFCFDQFLIHASDAEIGQAYQLFRDIKIEYTHRLLDTLTGIGEYGDAMMQHPSGPPGQGVSFLELGRLTAERTA